MKLIPSFALMTFISLSNYTITASAMSSGTQQVSQHKENTQTQFNLSGKITRYQRLRKLLAINGHGYILDGKGLLSDADLVPGTRVHYNVERPNRNQLGHITRIWITPQ